MIFMKIYVNLPTIISGLNDSSGTSDNYRKNRAHEPAVPGVVSGDLNSSGIMGIALSAIFIGLSVYNNDSAINLGLVSVSTAIQAVFDRAQAGDVIFLEQCPRGPLQPPPKFLSIVAA
jgi:hypothetical protein